MFESYEEARIYPGDRRGQRQLDALLEKEGIRRDGSLDYTLGLYDQEGELAATGSYYRNTLRCLAVDSAHQGEGLLNRVVSRLMELLADQGVLHLFLYTKCDKVHFFRDLGFAEIARVEGLAAFLENRRDGFARYLEELTARAAERPLPEGAVRGAIVMNANPFTLGHQWLVEQAAAGLPNVMVHQTGSYMISSATFPSYFIRDAEDVALAQARLDLQVFRRIAGALGITARFVGSHFSG